MKLMWKIYHLLQEGPAQSKLAMNVHECTWKFMEYHGKKHGFS